MNEEQIRELVQNLDNDLMEKELDVLMGDIEIDMDSISKKAHSKLNKERIITKMKKRRIFSIIAASLVIVVGVTTVYASDISDFIKSFLNKTGIYSTVVEGPAYYLESPIKLDNGGELRKVIFSGDILQLVLFLPNDEIPAELSVKTDNATHEPYGLSKGPEGMEIAFIKIKPCETFELLIDGKQYLITLTSGKSVISGGDIIPAEPNGIDWVDIGYRRTESGVQILTNFTDKNLQLIVIGEPQSKEVKADFTNNENGGGISNSTSPSPKPLLGYDKDKNIYEYSYDTNDTGRPLTMFNSDAPADKEIELKIPAIVVGYDKDYAKFEIEIPIIGEEKTIHREIDLGLQKIVLQSIARTSATTAELKFALNTGEQKTISVRDANIDIFNKDVRSGELLWKGDVCTMNITFNEELKNAELSVGWPTFIVNGDWTLIVK